VGRLNPVFVEWLMGLDAGHVTDVPGLSRTAQLKALGNGVMPQQAAAALRHLTPACARTPDTQTGAEAA
jgi:DNA (cytosine-5)-methyltransferase 1